MAVRNVLQLGDTQLKTENREVTDFNSSEVKRVIEDLTDTMRKQGLIGMAAPQIGENWRIFVTEPRATKTRSADQADELRVYINPEIVFFLGEQSEIYEGCGSVCQGQLFGPVLRPQDITVEAYDPGGKRFRFTADGILARVIQHEYDHLSGVEFTEKISDYSKLLSLENYVRLIKDSPAQKKATIITKKELIYQ